MKRIFMIHRWSGGPNSDWRPWLKAELEKEGYQIFVPNMPGTEVPIIEKWVNYLEEIVGIPDDQTFFIGHSIGCQTILRYLQKIHTPIGGALFVAGWFRLEHLEDEEAKEIARPWMETPIDTEKIKRILPKSTLIISDNDPYNAFEENVQRFKEINSEIVVLQNAGHITAKDGFSEAPIIKDMMLSQLTNNIRDICTSKSSRSFFSFSAQS